MTSQDITKEIIVSMIDKGLFDGADAKATHETMRTERVNAVCKAYSTIAKTVNDCFSGKYE